jgi:hypothetical protein
MKHNVKTLFAAALAGSAALLASAANGGSASSSSSLNAGRSQTQQSTSAAQPTAQMEGQTVPLGQVPEAARTAIMQHSGGTNPKDVRLTTQNGKQLYTATFDQGKETSKVTVDRDGSLVAVQKSAVFAADVDLSKLGKSHIGFQQLPLAVQMTIKHRAGTSPVGNLSKSEVKGQTLYRADFDRNGVRHELFITPQGRVAAQVREVTVASQWTFDENGNLVANPGRQINEAAGAQAPAQHSGQHQSQK